MREQDLVHRAERAATALEVAWMRWRGRHGLGTGAMPPVTSYVGYSVEEPWGQPRVVFGIEAAEAERLVAILDQDDLGLPVEAELRAYPDRQSTQAAWTVPAGSPGVPAQAAPPAREPARPPMPGPSARTVPAARQPEPPAAAGPARQVPPAAARQAPAAPAREEPSAPARKDRPAPPPAEASPVPPAPARKARPSQASAGPAGPAPAGKGRAAQSAAARKSRSAQSAPAGKDKPRSRQENAAPPEPADSAVASESLAGGAKDLASGQPSLPDALSEAAAVADLPAELPDNEAAYLQELAARTVARPPIVAVRPHPAGLPQAPAPVGTPWRPGQVPGQPAGRRPDEAADLGSPQRDTAPPVRDAEPPAAPSRPVARLRSVSRLNRSRKQADAAQWTAADEPKRRSSDTAV